MSWPKPPSSDRLPIELKLRLLHSELETLEADSSWIEQRRGEIASEISYYEQLLEGISRPPLRRVK